MTIMQEILIAGVFFTVSIVVLILLIRHLSKKFNERFEEIEEKISRLSQLNALFHGKEIQETLDKLKREIAELEKSAEKMPKKKPLDGTLEIKFSKNPKKEPEIEIE